MSIKLMAQAWETPLSGNQKLVLLALADYANDDGVCYPSVKTISAKTGSSERTVKYIIKAFEIIGICSHEKRNRENGSRSSNLYNIKIVDIDIVEFQRIYKEITSSKVQELHPQKEPIQSATSAIQSATIAPLEPSVEPSDNVRPENQVDELSENDLKVSEYLFAHVLEIFPKTKKPNWVKWNKHVRLMREQDGTSHQGMLNLISIIFKGNEFYKDTFWRGNIRSTEKLREQYDSISYQVNTAFEKKHGKVAS